MAIDYNGWDHHAMQGASYGEFANMMGNVSQSIEAFVDDLGPKINNTVVLTMSEFGRTAREKRQQRLGPRPRRVHARRRRGLSTAADSTASGPG